jgi:hypothetical protein
MPHIIDCDIQPVIPPSLVDVQVCQHLPGGKFEWDPNEITLHLCEGQEEGIPASEVYQKLDGLPCVNGAVMDFLLEHQELIPEDWQGKAVFFWGTIFAGPSDCFYVGYIRRLAGTWYRESAMFHQEMTKLEPAAVFKE